MKLKEKIAARVRTLRDARGLSQEQLAELIDRSVDTISNIERAKSEPGLETILLAARALNVPLLELIGEEAKKTDPVREQRITQALSIVRGLDARTLETAVEMLQVLERHGRSKKSSH